MAIASLVPKVPPLLDYIPIISPEFRPPRHLISLVDVFAAAVRGEAVRVLITFPIRHFKTETVLHGCLWMLEHDPALRIVIMTYSHERAQWLGKRLRVLASRTDVGPMKGHNTIEQWQNEQGGGVIVMSAEQSREGYDCHVLLVDDPLDEHSAKIQEKRDAVDNAILHYSARCQRQTDEGYRPGPVIIVMSRFDEDDPIGRREMRKAETWRNLWSPAVVDACTKCGTVIKRSGGPGCDCNAGHERRAFAPDVWSLEKLDELRAIYREADPKERLWFSRLMGVPPPNVTSRFGEPKRYAFLPEWPGFFDAIGVDMSFSKSKRADYSAVAIVRWQAGVCYVREIRRTQGEVNDLAALIREVRKRYGDLPMFSYTSGPEIAAIHHLSQLGLPIEAMHASDPKFIRAQLLIDAHNGGTCLWPMDPWVDVTMREFKRFAGNESDHDDQVDALVSVFNATRMRNAGGSTWTCGRRRM